MIVVNVRLGDINVTIFANTPAVAQELRLAFACELNVTAQQVLFNSTCNAASSVCTYYTPTADVNALPAEDGCALNPSRRLQVLMQGDDGAHGAPFAWRRHDGALARRLQATSLSATVALVILVPPPPVPSPAVTSSGTATPYPGSFMVVAQQYALASQILAALTSIVSNFAANGTSSPLAQSLMNSGFVDAVAAAAGVNASAILSSMSVTAPELLAGPPSAALPMTSSGLTNSQISGIVIGTIVGAVIFAAVAVIQIRQARQRAGGGVIAAPIVEDAVSAATAASAAEVTSV